MKEVSIKRNFIMNIVLTLSSFIFPLITFPYISRILLPEGVGKVNFAVSVITYFNMIAQLGIPTYGIRACAKVRNDKNELSKTVRELLTINIIMAVISYLIFFVVLFTVPRLSSDRKLYVVISFTILLSAIGMEWFYQGLELYTYITIRSIVFKVIAMLAMFALVHSKNDYVIYGGLSIFAASASNVLNLMNARKYIDFKKKYVFDYRKHLKSILVFLAMSVSITIYTNLDIVMLGFLRSDTDVGYYTAAVKIKSILVCIVTSLGTVLLPRASYYIEQRKMEEFQRICSKSIQFVFFVASPLVVYFMLFARSSIYFLSGSSFEGAVMPMRIITPAVLFIGLSGIMGMQMLVPMGKEKTVLKSTIAGAAIDFIINAFLITKLGAAGAVIGTVAAELTVVVIQYFSLKEYVKKIFTSLHYLNLAFAISIASLLTAWTLKMDGNSFTNLLISAPLFFGIYLLILFIRKETIIIEIVLYIKNRIMALKKYNN